jgi:ABC-type antimicrobial peptide transport system permease subunit
LGDRATALKDSVVLSLRSKPGDDASCNNLYKANQPRVLGVTPEMIEHFDNPDVQAFTWAASAAESEAERANPWRLLDQTLPDGRVPVVIDKNTAMFSLQLYGGIGEDFEFVYDPGITVRFRVVGLLSNSVLQGNLLIGEKAFQQQFKDVPGYGYFLIQCPPDAADQVVQTLEDALGDQGFDATSAPQLLGELLAVQNTYLSTFQSLGALGLLLGTFGLATVQLRNVVERRSELALLRSVGFGRRRLAQMVSLENLILLLGGLGVGVIAALWAVLPHMYFGNASIPFRGLALMLSVVLLVGVLTSLIAVRATLRAPLLSALRGE